MTKKELVWLLIRAAGVYFGYLTIVSILSVITLLPALIFAPPDLRTAQNTNSGIPVTEIPASYNINGAIPGDAQPKVGAEQTDETASENVKNFLWNLVLSIIYGAVAFYLLRDGRLFYFLLMKEESAETKQAEPEVTTLNL